MKIAVIPCQHQDTEKRQKAMDLAQKATKWLRKRGLRAWLILPSTPNLKRLVRPDIALVFSGDGFLVHTASYFSSQKVPVLGINTGEKGVLTMGEAEDWEEVLKQVIDRNFTIEKRLMLEILVKGRRFLAVNDTYPRHPIKMILVTVRVNKKTLYENLPGDGVIVATPTGSTAYNKSAGGPIVKPGAKCIIITPNNPDNVNVKPVVCKEKDIVEVVYLGTKSVSRMDTLFIVDGDDKDELRPGDKIEVRASKNHTYFAVLEGYSYFEALQRKIGLSR